MIDVRKPDAVLARVSQAQKRFEAGGGVPNATRELLVGLDDALGDSGPLELGVPPGHWLRAHRCLRGVVTSLWDNRTEVPVADAERALRAARRVFRLAAWSAPRALGAEPDRLSGRAPSDAGHDRRPENPPDRAVRARGMCVMTHGGGCEMPSLTPRQRVVAAHRRLEHRRVAVGWSGQGWNSERARPASSGAVTCDGFPLR